MNEAKAAVDQGADKLVFGGDAIDFPEPTKVARTIADLRGEADISAPAMAEAIQYRMLDAKYWSR